MDDTRGFTLVEMLLSVGILALVVGFSLPVYNIFSSRNDLVLTTQSVASMLRRGEVYARGNVGDSQWGVNIQSSTVTLFQGSSYATRASAYDETLSVPSSITASYSGDIIFAKLTGVPSVTPTITFSSAASSSNLVVSINAKGTISD